MNLSSMVILEHRYKQGSKLYDKCIKIDRVFIPPFFYSPIHSFEAYLLISLLTAMTMISATYVT